jgi:hypothetical protein
MVQFWHDLGCEEQPLKFSYPELFSIAHCNDAWVADHMKLKNGNSQINITLYRLLFSLYNYYL